MYSAEQAAAFISHCIASDWNQYVVSEAVQHAPKAAVRAVLIGFLPCRLELYPPQDIATVVHKADLIVRKLISESITRTIAEAGAGSSAAKACQAKAKVAKAAVLEHLRRAIAALGTSTATDDALHELVLALFRAEMTS